MVFSAKNLSLRAYSPSLPRFVLLHVWWHQCHCDLYRFLIPGFRESISRALLSRVSLELSQHCQSQCLAHARSLAEIFELLQTLESETPIIEASLAVPAYQCANILSRSVHMHGLLTTGDVKTEVVACLHFAQQLARYNPMAVAIQEDIQRLLDYGAPSTSQSRQRTPEPVDHPSGSTTGTAASAHVHKFSRHNIIATAGIQDDSTELALRNTASPSMTTADVRSGTALSGPAYTPALPGPPSAPPMPLQQDLRPPYPGFFGYETSQQPSASQNARDWPWDFSFPLSDEASIDFMFDPAWQTHYEWTRDYSGQ